jgi:hypothetical protein
MAPIPIPSSSSTNRRRRRPTPSWLSVAATLALTGYATYRLACWAWNTNKEKEDDEEENDVLQGRCRKNVSSERFTITAEEELMNALKACGPLLMEAVDASTDCTAEVKALKKLRKKDQKQQSVEEDGSYDNCEWKQKQEIWEKIKEKSITRLLLITYSQPLIILILYVEILILRRRALQHDKAVVNCDARKELFTRTLDNFFSKTIPKLSFVLQKSVHSRLCFWTVATTLQMYKSEFEAGIQAVRWNFDAETQDRISTFVVDFDQELPPRDTAKESEGNALKNIINCFSNDENEADSILKETWDILESPFFRDAWKDAISDFASFGHSMRLAVDKLFLQNDSTIVDVQHTLPLATIITKLKKSSEYLFYFENGGAEMVSRLLNFPTVLILARSCLES